MSCPVHGEPRQFDFRKPWLRFDEAAAYIGCRHKVCGCPSAKAFYEWRKRHGVVAHNGRVTRADLDQALRADSVLVFGKRSA